MKDKLFDKFLHYETQHKLFDIEFKNIKIWEILRTYVYIEIEQIYNNLQPLFPQTKVNKKRKISLKTIKNGLLFFKVKNKDYIFLNNPRRVKQKDGLYYCIYTDLLIDLLKKENKCITFEDPFWALNKNSNISHFNPVKTDDIVYLDIIEYFFSIKKFLFKTINKKQYKQLNLLLKSIEDDIEKEFNCNLCNIFKLAEEKILYLILMYKTYLKAFKRINPKAVLEFYDAFPSKVISNKVAKELNIPIIEIQHGIVTERNPIFLKYSNIKKKYDCTPDYVLSYGKKLLNKKHLPIREDNIYYIGSLFLEYKKNEYKNNKINKKNILFISQSNLGKYISEYASKLATLLEQKTQYQIIYKMHPYEIGTEYECLNKSNITIINNREKDLYYYQSISVAQVGIYSTGLYEGINFGLKTFIIDNNFGTEEIKGILKNDKNIFYINSMKEIIDILENSNYNKIVKNKYWTEVDKKYIKKIIYNISKKNSRG